jgi:hypothetical protein
MNSIYSYNPILLRRRRIIKKKEMRYKEEIEKVIHDAVEELKKDEDSRVCRTIGYLRSNKDGDWRI